MAAYAALVSLMHIIDQIQHHPRPPLSLNKNQVESLTEKVTILQEFLEGYSMHAGCSKEADALGSRIAGAAYDAEDIIESHVVDQILAGSTSHVENISSSIDLYKGLQKVIEDMDSMEKEVMEIKKKMGVQDQLQRSSTPAGSLRSSSTGQNITMVGFDDVLLEVMDKLTGGRLDRQIIPIVGMGGIGKTTLARNIITERLIKEYFDICAWATISQEDNVQEILREVLSQVNKEGMGDLIETQFGERLYKSLSGRRYLIVMDDIWNIKAWDKIKFFFPNCNNRSRILITTRLSNLAFQLANSYGLNMKFLDEDKSWNLFCKTVFGKEDCPPQLEEIGKKIAKNCKGLPLSIVVIGGLLAKSEQRREYWEYIEKNLNSIVNSENNEHCLKILQMSYNQLPIYLKPCFLYMGVFKEDRLIHVSTLIKLWVAEGILRPIRGKSLEVVAEEYLKELINRNLVLVHKMGSTGSIKYCNMHDLVRDLCLKEVEKERFYDVTRQPSLSLPKGINTQRRVVIHESTSKEEALNALQSMSLTRSLICNSGGVLPSLDFRLLRILKAYEKNTYSFGLKYSLKNMFQLVNSRYLAFRAPWDSNLFPSSVNLLWNLQTLIVKGFSGIAPAEIWKLPQLRHVEFGGRLILPDPPCGGRDHIVLGNLQTLKTITNFKCGEEVVKRIPNITKLGIQYEGVSERTRYFLYNLERLHKLEAFGCYFYPIFTASRTDILQELNFPHSLKKLALQASHVQYWEGMLEKIAPLPLLERLTLWGGSFKREKWKTVEGQFCRLKFLRIGRCENLKYWTTERSHFPCLEQLDLRRLSVLEGVPLEIGEIATLQSIYLEYCSKSAVISAKKILEEKEELDGEGGLQVRAILYSYKKEATLERLAGSNFKIQFLDMLANGAGKLT